MFSNGVTPFEYDRTIEMMLHHFLLRSYYLLFIIIQLGDQMILHHLITIEIIMIKNDGITFLSIGVFFMNG